MRHEDGVLMPTIGNNRILGNTEDLKYIPKCSKAPPPFFFKSLRHHFDKAQWEKSLEYEMSNRRWRHVGYFVGLTLDKVLACLGQTPKQNNQP